MTAKAIAIDLGGTEIKGALVDESARIDARRQIATGADLSPAAVIERLADVIRRLRDENGAGPLVGVGIGCPGGIYPDSGLISQSPNFPGWFDVDLRGPLRALTGLPIALGNDANVAALAEWRHGVGRGVDSMILITLGTGIGGGVILNGRIWGGTWGMAGEIGHVIVEPDGLPCGCGGWGCVESYASGPAIVREARARFAEADAFRLRDLAGGEADRVTPKLLFDAATQGCSVSRAVFARAGRYLGMAVASVLNVLNVPLFVIGGGVSAAFDMLVGPMRTEVRRRAYRIPGENVRIERAQLGNDAGMIGAGLLAFSEQAPQAERTGP